MHKIYKKVILAAIALLFMVSSGYALPSQFANVQWPQTSAEEEAEAYAALLGSSFEPKINVTQMRPRHSSVKKVKLSPRKPSLPNHKVFVP